MWTGCVNVILGAALMPQPLRGFPLPLSPGQRELRGRLSVLANGDDFLAARRALAKHFRPVPPSKPGEGKLERIFYLTAARLVAPSPRKRWLICAGPDETSRRDAHREGKSLCA